MAQHGDFTLKDGLLQFADGDILISEQKEQILSNIVNADKGNFRRWATLGAGLIKLLDGVLNSRDISATIIQNAELDGWNIRRMNIEDQQGELDITIEQADKVTDNTKSLI